MDYSSVSGIICTFLTQDEIVQYQIWNGILKLADFDFRVVDDIQICLSSDFDFDSRHIFTLSALNDKIKFITRGESLWFSASHLVGYNIIMGGSFQKSASPQEKKIIQIATVYAMQNLACYQEVFKTNKNTPCSYHYYLAWVWQKMDIFHYLLDQKITLPSGMIKFWKRMIKNSTTRMMLHPKYRMNYTLLVRQLYQDGILSKMESVGFQMDTLVNIQDGKIVMPPLLTFVKAEIDYPKKRILNLEVKSKITGNSFFFQPSIHNSWINHKKRMTELVCSPEINKSISYKRKHMMSPYEKKYMKINHIHSAACRNCTAFTARIKELSKCDNELITSFFQLPTLKGIAKLGAKKTLKKITLGEKRKVINSYLKYLISNDNKMSDQYTLLLNFLTCGEKVGLEKDITDLFTYSEWDDMMTAFTFPPEETLISLNLNLGDRYTIHQLAIILNDFNHLHRISFDEKYTQEKAKFLSELSPTDKNEVIKEYLTQLVSERHPMTPTIRKIYQFIKKGDATPMISQITYEQWICLMDPFLTPTSSQLEMLRERIINIYDTKQLRLILKEFFDTYQSIFEGIKSDSVLPSPKVDISTSDLEMDNLSKALHASLQDVKQPSPVDFASFWN